MSNLKNFIFNSDYPADKVVFAIKGTIKITSASPWQPMFMHNNTGIKAQLYAEGVYKIGDDDTLHPMSYMASTTGIVSAATTLMHDGECYVSPVFIVFDNSLVGKEITYWAWAYADESSAKNTDIAPTSNIHKTILAFDSGANYPRFISDGFINQGDTYSHNFGYKPLAKFWRKQHVEDIPSPSGSGTIAADTYSPTAEAFFGDISAAFTQENVIRVTDSQITTYPSTDQTIKGFYYRLYAL